MRMVIILKKTVQIAIDGPSGSGKSTLAKNLAKKLGYIYIDTGALYRAVGLYAAENRIPESDPERVIPLLGECRLEMRLENGGNAVFLNGKCLGNEIRTEEISRYASQVSKVPEVRQFLLETQRAIARTENVIMDGRDIGTVVLPEADVKIFMSASPEARASRRYRELVAKGERPVYQDVLKDIVWRDKNDSEREIAPAVPAADAVLMDNTALDIDGTVDYAMKIIRERMQSV